MVRYLENFLTNMAVKEFWKSVHICQSYDKKSSVLFFLRHSVHAAVILYNDLRFDVVYKERLLYVIHVKKTYQFKT